jgi:hypothetical protein
MKVAYVAAANNHESIKMWSSWASLSARPRVGLLPGLMPTMSDAAARLAALGCCPIDYGLTDAEFDRVEREFGFEFADDHRAFLAAGLPVNEDRGHPGGWPDWRHGSHEALRAMLDQPVEGVLFDVEHNVMWDVAWGPRPADMAEALEIAGRRLAEVPQLVPVYIHRYLPAGRGTSGHPVLSVMQTDIIYYGVDLAEYIHQEFGGPGLDRYDPRWQPRATVPFWGDFL